MFNHWTLKKRLTLTFAAILPLAGAADRRGPGQHRQAARDGATGTRTPTRCCRSPSSMLLSMVNIETGLRGFVAGGDEKFLEPFKAGPAGLRRRLQGGQVADLGQPRAAGPAGQADGQPPAVHGSRQRAGRPAPRRHGGQGAAGGACCASSAPARTRRRWTPSAPALPSSRRRSRTCWSCARQRWNRRCRPPPTRWRWAASACLALTGVLGLALTRSVFRQLGAEPSEAAAAVNAVAQGDLTVQIALRPGDTASLMAALARMRDSLAKVVTDVRGNSESVATASAQIAQGNQDLSGRTEAAGQRAAADRRHDGRAGHHGAQQRRQRQAGQPAGAGRVGGGGAGRRGGRQGGHHHAGHQRQQPQDRRHHQRHRRHRLPDQHPGAERGGRSRPRRRAGPRLRGGGLRGAQPGAAQRRGGQGDQDR